MKNTRNYLLSACDIWYHLSYVDHIIWSILYDETFEYIWSSFLVENFFGLKLIPIKNGILGTYNREINILIQMNSFPGF